MDTHTLERLDFPQIRERLATYATCDLGRGMARRIEPVARPDLIRRWHQQVRELSALIEPRGLPPLAGVRDVRDVVRRCAPPLRVSTEEMAHVGDALSATHEVCRYLADLPDACGELRRLAERIGDFQAVAERIRAAIDERAQMRDQASAKLGRIRSAIRSAMDEIVGTVERLLRDPSVRRLLQYANYTFHGDRMVVPLRTEYRGRLAGIVHRSSDSGQTLYVEPAQAVELNNRISNLRSEEAEEIHRILWDLSHAVHLNGEAILKTLDALGVLDLLTAKVRYAGDFALRIPEIVDEPALHVRQARHPLLLDLARQRAGAAATAAEDGAGQVVPISYRIGEDFDLLLVTGPNTGGKTVTLKTVGLLCLMVQSGLPVPVGEGSRFGVFDRILIDIGDEQSMQQSLSTFSAHLTRQLDMVRKAGPRTLLLIDELGAGTDPEEGAAIGQALLDELLRMQCRCFATTHLGALKGLALTRARVENASVDFDVQTLRPTYHLRIGEAGMSNAISIAQRLGMPKRLVHAARQQLPRDAKALRRALAGVERAKRVAEAARREADDARLAAGQTREKADAEKRLLERQRADFQDWVRAVVNLRQGDAVRVRNFDRDGRVVRMRLDLHRAEVDVGPFSIEVPLGELLPPQAPAPPPRAPAARSGDSAASAAGGGRPRGVPPRVVLYSSRGRRRERGTREAQRDATGAGAAAAQPEQRDGRRAGPAHASQPLPMPSLTAEQAEQLRAGDRLYVKRFHREGVVVRVNAARRVAVVTVGVLELEVPFEALALPEVAQRTLEARRKAAKEARAEQARTNAAPRGTLDVPEGGTRDGRDAGRE